MSGSRKQAAHTAENPAENRATARDLARAIARACGLRGVKKVHQGALFAIHRGQEPGLGRTLAVKSLRPGLASHSAARRLWHEARIRASVNEPGLLPLIRVIAPQDSGHAGPLVVGPWLPGGALADRATPLHGQALARVIADLGEAIDALHAAGWSHTDVHRRNVLLTASGRAVLSDLATAQRLGAPWLPRTRRGPREITPQVVPPEAWRGQPVDERGDVYALGVLVYRELTGQFPFAADSVDDYARLHCEAEVPRPSHLAAVTAAPMTPATERVLLRALAKNPAQRPASARALASELGAALAGPDHDARSWIAAHAARPPHSSDPADAADTPGPAVLTAAGAHLEQFAATLDARERAALSALLAQARAVEERAAAEVASMTSELFGVPAALLALEQSGAARALARDAQSADELARALNLARDPLHGVLSVLAAAGLVLRQGRGDRFALPPPLRALYLSPAATRPLDDTLRMWTWLPALLAHGEPYVHMDSDDGARYAGVVHILGALFEVPARNLAAALQPLMADAPAVLDLGAGSAVWSLAIASQCQGATVTAVDRAAVLDSARHGAQARGLGDRVRLVPGDYHQVELEPAGFDVALLANVCHLESPQRTAQLILRAAQAVRPGGLVIVVDTIPARARDASLRTHLHSLRLQLRTAAGRLHDRGAYEKWLRAAGLAVHSLVPLQGDEQGVSALIARRHSKRSPRRAAPSGA